MLCRLCLDHCTENNGIPLFCNTHETVLVKLIAKYLFLEVTEHDSVSTTICHGCMVHLTEINKFCTYVDVRQSCLREDSLVLKSVADEPEQPSVKLLVDPIEDSVLDIKDVLLEPEATVQTPEVFNCRRNVDNRLTSVNFTKSVPDNVGPNSSRNYEHRPHTQMDERVNLLGKTPMQSTLHRFSTEKSRPLYKHSNSGFYDLLSSWNLQHLVNFFESEKINLTILKIMKPHHVKDLFKNQKIGDTVLFEHYYTEWRKTFASARKIENKESQFPYPSTRGRSSPETSDVGTTLTHILKEDRKSFLITKFYESQSKLLDEHRQLLMKIICNHFEEHKLPMTLATSYKLEQEILQLFPKEKLEYYRTGKRGKIYTKYCNAKSSFKSLFKRSSSSDIFKDDSNKTVGRVFNPEDDAENCIRRLRSDNLTASDFDRCWKGCSQFRLNELLNGNLPLASIFLKWPEYKRTGGYRLIERDFDAVFDHSSGVLTNWPKNLKKLKDFLQKEHHIKDKAVKAMLTLNDEPDGNKESAAVKLLWCLHAYLVPTQKIINKDDSGKRSMVKFTIRGSQEAFIFIGSSDQDIQDHIRLLKAKSEIIQPFILAIGDQNFKSFTNFFVYLDGVNFAFTSFLKALDVCFKSFHLFNLEYPVACNQVWSFIEEHFYGMQNKAIKSSKVSLMMEALKEGT